ncbi:hypothetical protein RSOL_085950, partial [Rhizoctonia solani AG-3 Rhs1AP]
MMEVKTTPISDEDNESTSNDEFDVAEPSEKAMANDTSASRKSVPLQRVTAPKLPIMTEELQHLTHLPGKASSTSIPLPISREENQRI